MLHPSDLARKLLHCAAAAALVLATGAHGADPFHERLLQDGLQALEQGDAALAARHLRLAAFGFLDEPRLLARALVCLGAAQAREQDAAGFGETVRRLGELESRFGAYGQAEAPAAVREEFERHFESLPASVRQAPDVQALASAVAKLRGGP